jgi:hypothetical protein
LRRCAVSAEGIIEERIRRQESIGKWAGEETASFVRLVSLSRRWVAHRHSPPSDGPSVGNATERSKYLGDLLRLLLERGRPYWRSSRPGLYMPGPGAGVSPRLRPASYRHPGSLKDAMVADLSLPPSNTLPLSTPLRIPSRVLITSMSVHP